MSLSLAKANHMGADHSPLWLRGRVWLRRGALDRMLAEGADPNSGPDLDLVGDDREPVSTEPPSLLTGAMAAASLGDMELERYGTRGVALVQRLLTDGDSPLYAPYPAGELELAVRHANSALLLR